MLYIDQLFAEILIENTKTFSQDKVLQSKSSSCKLISLQWY